VTLGPQSRAAGRVLATLLVCLLTILSRTRAQVPAADSAALVGVTRTLLDAITAGDSAVWASHLAPAWFMTDEEGRHLTRAEFLSEFHPLPAGQHGVLRLAEGHMTGTPDVAVLSYDIDEDHEFYGQRLHTRFHETDTWARSGRSWRALASQVSALPTPVEGRSIDLRTLRDYAGTYVLTPDISLAILADSAGLRLVRGKAPAERLYALDDRIFIRHGVRGFWVFEREAAGAVTRLVNWRDNNAVVWRRR
jgi:uncharacterized protein DUF4440